MSVARINRGLALCVVAGCVLAASYAGAASAAFHLFRINELYSSPDGTIQFIEIKESAIVDGCSLFDAFIKMAIPLSLPGILTMVI